MKFNVSKFILKFVLSENDLYITKNNYTQNSNRLELFLKLEILIFIVPEINIIIF